MVTSEMHVIAKNLPGYAVFKGNCLLLMESRNQKVWSIAQLKQLLILGGNSLPHSLQTTSSGCRALSKPLLWATCMDTLTLGKPLT